MEGFHQEPNIYVGEVNLKVENLDTALTFYQKFNWFSSTRKNRSEGSLNNRWEDCITYA